MFCRIINFVVFRGWGSEKDCTRKIARTVLIMVFDFGGEVACDAGSTVVNRGQL
jgi:hypothetical protein